MKIVHDLECWSSCKRFTTATQRAKLTTVFLQRFLPSIVSHETLYFSCILPSEQVFFQLLREDKETDFLMVLRM